MIARMLTGFVALLVVVACGTTGTSFADRQPASSDVAAGAPTAEAETAATVDAPVVPLNVDTQGTDDAARAAEEAATVAPTATSAPTPTALPAEEAATVAPTATPAPTPTVGQPPTALPAGEAATVAPTATPAPTPTVGQPPTALPAGEATTVAPTATSAPTVVASEGSGTYFVTLAPGAALPTDEACARLVRQNSLPETHPENQAPNAQSGGPSVLIDGAEGFRENALAARITGDFSGSTEDILRWAACKWGFDEDITRSRAWTESSWSMLTAGDRNNEDWVCALLGLSAPCPQSYGLLQVKGTIHEGTYPASVESTAWGVDYAMAWQRACFEGAFTWLSSQGYQAGDVEGCVGAWYSGEWYDAQASRYIAEVARNLEARPWDR